MAIQTIYVELLGEGVEAWRPVEATVEGDDAFRLPDEAPDGETWAFPPGSRVRCHRKALTGGQELVASELIG